MACQYAMVNHVNSEEVGSPVKWIRDLLGMSQQEFASWLDVSITTVSRWERGKTPPSFTVGQIRKLLKALEPHGLSLENLPDDMRPGNKILITTGGDSIEK